VQLVLLAVLHEPLITNVYKLENLVLGKIQSNSEECEGSSQAAVSGESLAPEGMLSTSGWVCEDCHI